MSATPDNDTDVVQTGSNLLDAIHADSHTDDAPTPFVAPRAYGHVTKAVFDRAWALEPGMLSFMADVVRFRSAGGLLSEDDIRTRLADAKAQNGERSGAVQAGAVAVIPMYGLISQRAGLMSDMSGGTSIEEMRGALRGALNDPTVSAVVFDIDSPGGSTDGVTEFASEIRSLRGGRKPIVAQVDTLAGSAAYWLASQMTEIAITPSGEAGSIGVFGVHEDVSKAAEMAGVKTTLISAGPFKTEGNEFEPLTDEARAHIQGQVDQFYSMFLHDVASGRRVSAETVASSYGQGRTLLAQAALEAGMVDRISTLEATIAGLQRPVASARRAAAIVSPPPAAIAASTTDRAWNARIAKHNKRSLYK